jgi:hypothetical protein
MPTDLNTAMDLLRVVQLKTKPQDGLHPVRQAEQIKEMAHDLVDQHPDDVREACKLWPRHNKEFPDLASLLEVVEGQKRLRLARERNPGQRRGSYDASDPWSAPFGLLGIGLQVVRGTYLMLEQGDDAVPRARAEFNRVVQALGLGEARRIADRHYRPGGSHVAVKDALEDALNPHGSHVATLEAAE